MLQVLQTTPGVFAGDDYHVEVIVESGASVVIMNPSATKLHRMADGGFARQQLEIFVHAGAHLEYYPALNIPFPETDFRQRAHVHVSEDARLGFLETWAMGRVERGEHLRFRRLSSRTAIDVAGTPLVRDALELSADESSVTGWGILEQQRYVVSGFWISPREETVAPIPVEPLDSLHAFGQPEAGQYYLRGLYKDGVQMNRAVGGAIEHVCSTWGLPSPPLGFFSC